MIIALTGKNAAGKGEAANYLQGKGFVYFSLSDELREEATKMGYEHTRINLIKIGNILRKKYGTNYLAKKVNEKILMERENGKDKFVVDSVRNPGEINELRKNKDFILLGIDAPIELRFKRIKERGRFGEAETLAQFIKLEEKENFNNRANQQLDKCLEMADKVIVNNGSLEELHEKIDRYLETIQ